MSFQRCLWDLDDDLDGNVVHIAEHGLTKRDVEEVLSSPLGEDRSRSSGKPIVFGRTRSGELVAVVYERIDDELVYPVTAFVVSE
ncbi:MAG: hypothetical protein M3552_01575 [Planctomycetota bacterium]|nr:hypothetical protein [Planctomycetaceae bacterium]MDQ3329336.1 hypothetical protein [Planctomycetota bacterium]